MAWITKNLKALVIVAVLVGIAIPASAASFSIFGGHHHRDRGHYYYSGNYHRDGYRVVGSPVVTTYNPYQFRGYSYVDEGRYRNYRDEYGRFIGRVPLSAFVGDWYR